MLPPGYHWRTAEDHLEVWHNGHCVASLAPYRGRVAVTLRLGHPSGVVHGSDRTMAGAKRHVERWIAARVGKS